MKSIIKSVYSGNQHIFFVPSFTNASIELEKMIAEQRQAVQAQEDRIAQMEYYIQHARTPVIKDIECNQEAIASTQLILEKIEKRINDSEKEICENTELEKKNEHMAQMYANKRKVKDELKSKKAYHEELKQQLVSIDKNIDAYKSRLFQAQSRLMRLQLRLSKTVIESMYLGVTTLTPGA